MPDAETVLIQGEDGLNDLPRFLVHDQMIFIPVRFLVAIRREAADKFTVFLFYGQTGTDFYGNIFAVRIICYVVRFNGFVQVPKTAQY